jgi:hypothetical protein
MLTTLALPAGSACATPAKAHFTPHWYAGDRLEMPPRARIASFHEVGALGS